ncbi:glucose-1-phosphate adenylyltransferase [Pyxidicoccus fallax]|uniref:Glucose-1-phosphate adenylyltransferase n=1 Tax=Pyxidicoccus fallax TaxID=394095 RepID=A0A848LFK9_9BACT|nr:glucose-1-phosphate adenylyltransferase family protein [Pyxidicoccus fallax]NMO15121.1 glucose-1-phosphate adenylyltransferase [Pyxidicoccus fallax]NPC77467.1 glucose-1-phosphate adenylyltransferase [Pyxidicoccus fallax]
MTPPKVLALILAGGKGSRLEVLTSVRAKPVAPFGGGYRLIDFALSNCVHSRLADVWVLEQYLPHSLNDHLSNGRPWDLDRTYGGLRVLPPFQAREEGGFAQGNADALYRQRHLLRAFDPDVLLVLSADHVYRFDYRDVIEAHLGSGAAVTAVTTEVPPERAHRFGVVQVDAGGRITRFDYKPEHPRGGTVTTEVFAYDARVLLDTLETLCAELGDEHAALEDFGHHLLPRLVSEGRARAWRMDGYWRDVGTLDSYWQGHMDLLGSEPVLSLERTDAPLLTYGVQRPAARVLAGARVEDSLVSPGCVVRGTVVRSVLGPGVRVEAGAVIRDSVLLGDVVVGADARVHLALLDEAVRVGAGAHVGDAERAVSGPPRPHVRAEELTVIGQQVRLRDRERVKPGERRQADANVDWRTQAQPPTVS